MDGQLQKIIGMAALINMSLHKLLLIALCFVISFCFLQPLTNKNKKIISGSVFEVEFSQFSPAFAAFEDGFLFKEAKEVFELKAGDESKSYLPSPKRVVRKSKTTDKNKGGRKLQAMGFDGTILASKIEVSKPKQKKLALQTKTHNKQPVTKKKASIAHNEELRFGALAQLVSQTSQTKNGFAPGPRALKNPGVAHSSTPIVSENSHLGHGKPNPEPQPETITVSGGITLTEGLVFLGAMDISWVVGDYEQAIGSINAPDAEFEIKVQELVGDIVLSLYDNKDQVIGEGFIDLTRANIKNGQIKADIQVRPVDWGNAGQVIDGYSIGGEWIGVHAHKSLAGVDIELYAFNEATQSNADGKFGFPNWKKTNSRSLAIASKKGYMDSIFMIDSQNLSDVVLFTEGHMEALFDFVEEQGVYEIKDKGTIYGSLRGQNVKGYTAHLESIKPIYFSTISLAQKNLEATTESGLFVFVGLEDGDYELSIKLGDQIIDHKVVVVEQGKVSPVIVNLRQTHKHIHYFDPLNPDEDIQQVQVNFFDGVETIHLDKNNTQMTTLPGGNGPVLLDYAGESDVTRTFVSRNKGLQRVPLIQNEILLKLAQKNDLKISEGLIFGFVDAEEAYRVLLKESPTETVLYFNQKGEEINPENEIAYGFIMGGFTQGLSSLLIESTTDQTTLATDFIYSDHQSISIINITLLPIY